MLPTRCLSTAYNPFSKLQLLIFLHGNNHTTSARTTATPRKDGRRTRAELPHRTLCAASQCLTSLLCSVVSCRAALLLHIERVAPVRQRLRAACLSMLATAVACCYQLGLRLGNPQGRHRQNLWPGYLAKQHPNRPAKLSQL
jgi:hypothetical protein